jgi:hypothetical protein
VAGLKGAAVVRLLGGFVLGALMVVFLPPLAFAIALVLGGLMLWARLRHQDVQPLTALAAGYLVAVVIYVGLAVAFALG